MNSRQQLDHCLDLIARYAGTSRNEAASLLAICLRLSPNSLHGGNQVFQYLSGAQPRNIPGVTDRLITRIVADLENQL